MEIKQDVLLKISQVVESDGAEMAFPTRTLYLESSEAALSDAAELTSNR